MSLNLPSNESTLLQLAKAMEEIVFVLHAKQRTALYTSSQCQQILGYTVEQLYSPSQSWLKEIYGERRNETSLAWQKHLAGENFDCQYQLQKYNSQRWLHSRFIYLKNERGENTSIVGIVKEVTVSKQTSSSQEVLNQEDGQKLLRQQNQTCLETNEQLEAQKQLLEKILHALPFSIFLKNRDSQFFFLNQTVRDAFGLQDRDSLTVDYEELFGSNAEGYRQDDTSVWETGQSLTKEETFNLDGQTRDLVLGRTLIQPTADTENHLLLSYAIDTTLQKQGNQNRESSSSPCVHTCVGLSG